MATVMAHGTTSDTSPDTTPDTTNAVELATAIPARDVIYHAIPLSVQRDDDVFVVGSVELGDFYHFPDTAVRILAAMRDGASVATIEQSLGDAASETDVEGFVATLLEIGFAYPGGAPPAEPRPARAAGDQRLFFRSPSRLAGLAFAPPALAIYAALVAVAGWCMVRHPVARMDPGSFYIEHGFTATLVLLILLSSVATAMHELGHMLAAARRGIPSRLSIGNRLWNIVAEADLSGIMSLPKRQRYLPLAAGMMVDVVNIAILTIVLSLWASPGGFAAQLLHALVLQIAVTITWQFNIFLRTDVYFLLCTWCNHPDLDSETRAYLAALRRRFSLGRHGAEPTRAYRNLAMVRCFALVWLAGRVLAVTTLVGVFVPTMVRYAVKAYRLATTPGGSLGSAADLGLFVLLSSLLVVAGMVLWLRQRAALQPGGG